ncbi:3-oxoacyl-ACP reductase FabG [Streptococcus equinus]|uniref:3-oxoacyl-ACP reductase FabG n=1 Tax=Streptococcus equinus TaxID=1335 RepID=UPI003BF91D14
MKVAIVTGGTRGIGAAISRELHKEGYQVIAIYAGNDACAMALKEELPGLEVHKCDVSDAKAVQKLVNTIFRTYGRIDCLVNNAGIIRDGYFLMMSDEKWHDVLNINLMGLVNMTKAVLRIMKAKHIQGKVVNISSTSGVAGQVGQANYSASKGAIIAVTKTLAKEFAKDRITVNCVSPGFIETDMTSELRNKAEIEEHIIPLGRFGKAEEVAWAVAFLVSDKANYITGKNLVIDGGMIND